MIKACSMIAQKKGLFLLSLFIKEMYLPLRIRENLAVSLALAVSDDNQFQIILTALG